MTTMKTATGSKALPWIRYSDDVSTWLDRQLGDTDRAEILKKFYEESGQPVAQRTPAPVRPVAITAVPATEPMKRLIDNLLVERGYTALTPQQIEKVKSDKAQSHRFITFLLGLPKVQVQSQVEVPTTPARARLDFSAILDGNYAIRTDGVVKFYRVSTNKNGYKNVQVRASDDLHPVHNRASIAILYKIVEFGLAESQMLFANELGRCWRCGKSLTDETSRARGTGPDCAGK